MVYLGKPSRGCDVCRKRRIKCDEAVPGCSYCLKKQITCPGYKSQFDVAWRNQNVVAENSVRRRQNAAEKADRGRIAEMQLTKLSSPRVPRALPQDYETYAVSFFFSSYVLVRKDPEVERGLLDCLHPVWIQTDSTSPLRPAVVAVASCLLEAWSQLKPDVPLSLSRSQYLRGVEGLRKSLQSTENVGDDVVMAALMLDMYEGLRAFWMSKPNESPHINGTSALVESRRRLPVASQTSQRVLIGARSQIVGRALSDSEAVPSNVSTLWELAKDVPKTAVLRLDDLNVEAANLQALASELNPATTAQKVSVAGILKKAIELDQRFIAWTNTVPDDWTATRVSGPECIPQRVRDAGLYQDHCDIYKSVFVAYTFNSYCCSRIKLQQMILACLKLRDGSDCDIALVTALGMIQDLADTMCASVPFHLGDRTTTGRIDDKTVQYPTAADSSVSNDHHVEAAAFGGWLLAVRLPQLLSPKLSLRSGQRQWIGGQMQRITKIYALQPYKAT